MTLRLQIEPWGEPNPRKIQQAVEVLHRGGVAAYPTDSIYALGCAIESRDAIEKIFRGRYGRADGQEIPVKITRDGTPMTLPLKVRLSVTTQQRIIFDASASPKALRVRKGILTGQLGG